MEWLAENWFWVLLGLAFIAMHLFGHGSHGSHGSQSEHGGQDSRHGGLEDNRVKKRPQKHSDLGSGHH